MNVPVRMGYLPGRLLARYGDNIYAMDDFGRSSLVAAGFLLLLAGSV